MGIRFFTALLSMLLVLLLADATAQETTNISGACNIGPVLKEFGGTEWNVYSCASLDQVVVVSAPGNPAMPFFFALYIKDGQRKLHGEGTGAKEATAAAYEELKVIADSEEKIAALIAETQDAAREE